MSPNKPDGNGDLGKLRSRVASIEYKLKSNFDVQTTTLEALKTVLDGLEKSHAQMTSRLEAEWDRPKKYFYGAISIITLFVGVNLVSQYWTVSDLSNRANQLHDETKESSKQRFETMSELVRFKESVAASTERIYKDLATETKTSNQARADLVDKAGELQKDIDLRMSELAETRKLMIEVEKSAHLIMTTISFGRDRLIVEKNPQRALEYALEANQQFVDITSRIDREELSVAILPLHLPVLALHAECLFQLGDMPQLKSVAHRLTQDYPMFLDGHYYFGLCQFSQLIESRSQPHDGQNITDEVVSHLEKATRGQNQRVLAQLFLAAACYQCGQYERSRATAQAFRDSFAKTPLQLEKSQLSNDLQAQITLAAAIETIAKAALRGHTDFECDVCKLPAGAIGNAEASLFGKFFQHVISNRYNVVGFDDAMADRLGIFCLKAMNALKRAVDSGGCCSPGDEPIRFELYEQHELQVPEDEIPPISEWKGYEITQKDGTKRLKYLDFSTIEIDVVINNGGVRRTERRKREIPKVIEVSVDSGQTYPQRRYIMYDFDGFQISLPPHAPDSPKAAPAKAPKAE